MKNLRMWLVILSIISIASVAFMGIFSPAIQEGTMAKDWMGIFGLMMAGSIIANIFIAYRYAWKTGRQAGLYALGTFLLPYIVPLILAFLPTASSGVEVNSDPISETSQSTAISTEKKSSFDLSINEKLFTSITEYNSEFKLKEGLFQSTQWALNKLRLFCIVVPGSFKWRVVTSSQELMYEFPDLMSPEDEFATYLLIDKLCSDKNPNYLSGIKLCMADYNDHSIVLDLGKLKKESIPLLANLHHYRIERKEKLKQWIASNPKITLQGMGSKATLDHNGFHFKKRSLSWPEVKKISIEETTMVSHLYVLPEGYSDGLFNLKKMKYALARIPNKKKELYAAECFFWKTYCDQ